MNAESNQQAVILILILVSTSLTAIAADTNTQTVPIDPKVAATSLGDGVSGKRYFTLICSHLPFWTRLDVP